MYVYVPIMNRLRNKYIKFYGTSSDLKNYYKLRLLY